MYQKNMIKNKSIFFLFFTKMEISLSQIGFLLFYFYENFENKDFF